MFRCRTAFGLALVLFVFSSVAAHAQFGAYGTITGERLTGFTCSDPQGTCSASGGVVRPYGSMFGGYYDFRSMGPMLLGVDVRGAVLNSNKSATTYASSVDLVRQYSVLGGLRGEFKTPFRILHPYGEVAVGYMRSNAAGTNFNDYAYSGYTQVEGFAGLDVTLLPVMDIRAIELGFGGAFGSDTHSIQSIGIGVTFHTPR
jgi:hypothetical protein